MKNSSIVRALVVGLGVVIESLPPKTQRRACDMMADIVSAGLVSDPDAESLIETFAEPSERTAPGMLPEPAALCATEPNYNGLITFLAMAH